MPGPISRGELGAARMPVQPPGNAAIGALWMLASAVAFTAYLALAKALSSDVHPLFIGFWRAFIGLLVVLPLLARQAPPRLHTRQFPLLLGRSFAGLSGFTLSLFAISDFFDLPLAQFNALSFSRPLFVTILAALILREQVGVHRWGAVLVGFAGILVMTVPGAVGEGGLTMDGGTAMAILSAIGFAGGIILVKQLTKYHTTLQLLVWANLMGSVLLLPLVVIYWVDIGWDVWGLIIAMSLSGLLAQTFYITAMRRGDASFLSSMDYLRLPMAALVDWWMIRKVPGLSVWIGAGIVASAALYIAFRESLRRRG